MASSSNVAGTQVSQAVATKMVEEWEAKVCSLILNEDEGAWKKAQYGLFKELVSLRHSCPLNMLTSFSNR
jgi:hypothetical protein